MDTNSQKFSQFHFRLRALNQYYLAMHEEKVIWQLAEKGILFDLFQKLGTNNLHLQTFYKKVEEAIKKREAEIKVSSVAELTVFKGKYLSFDPAATMYDGVAEEVISGFFDSDDVPPPEFWLGIDNGILISFIPEDLVNTASSGIDACLSGCLEWVTD